MKTDGAETNGAEILSQICRMALCIDILIMAKVAQSLSGGAGWNLNLARSAEEKQKLNKQGVKSWKLTVIPSGSIFRFVAEGAELLRRLPMVT